MKLLFVIMVSIFCAPLIGMAQQHTEQKKVVNAVLQRIKSQQHKSDCLHPSVLRTLQRPVSAQPSMRHAVTSETH